MGTIRNKMIIIHHYDAEIIKVIHQDAINHFQNLVLKSNKSSNYNVSKDMVSPILTSFTNGEYSFVIMGDCSKLGWTTSKIFEEGRKEWVEKWRNSKDSYMVLVADFGEDYDSSIEE